MIKSVLSEQAECAAHFADRGKNMEHYLDNAATTKPCAEAAAAVMSCIIMLFIGFLVRKLKILQDSFLPQLNKIVFNVFFPFLMFNNIYGSDFSSVFSPKLLAFAVIGVFTIYFLSIGFTLLVEKSNYSRGAMIQAIYRSNFVLMGLPIAANIFPDL